MHTYIHTHIHICMPGTGTVWMVASDSTWVRNTIRNLAPKGIKVWHRCVFRIHQAICVQVDRALNRKWSTHTFLCIFRIYKLLFILNSGRRFPMPFGQDSTDLKASKRRNGMAKRIDAPCFDCVLGKRNRHLLYRDPVYVLQCLFGILARQSPFDAPKDLFSEFWRIKRTFTRQKIFFPGILAHQIDFDAFWRVEVWHRSACSFLCIFRIYKSLFISNSGINDASLAISEFDI